MYEEICFLSFYCTCEEEYARVHDHNKVMYVLFYFYPSRQHAHASKMCVHFYVRKRVHIYVRGCAQIRAHARVYTVTACALLFLPAVDKEVQLLRAVASLSLCSRDLRNLVAKRGCVHVCIINFVVGKH